MSDTDRDADPQYGPDFDPVAQFDEIHAGDFGWYKGTEELVVFDGNDVRGFNGWHVVAELPEDRHTVCDPRTHSVCLVLNDPVAWRKSHPRGDEATPQQKVRNELAWMLTETVCIERDKPAVPLPRDG